MQNFFLRTHSLFFSAMFYWNQKQRTMLGVFLISVELLSYVVWLWMTSLVLPKQFTVNYSFMELIRPLSLWFIVFSCISIITLRSINHKNTTAIFIFQFFFLLLYSLSVGFIAHFAGELSLLTGIAISCTPVLGLLIFNRVISIYIFILNMCIFLAMILAISGGYIKDAPLFSTGYFVLDKFWVVTFISFTIVKLSLVIMAMDIMLTSLVKNDSTIDYLSKYDALTNIMNRRTVLEKIHNFFSPEETQFQKHQIRQASIAILDIDNFKSINDKYGHTVGDQVLAAVAQELSQHIRHTDYIGRYGGEEFIVFLKDCTLEQGLAMTEGLRQRLYSLAVSNQDGDLITITASFGVASSDKNKNHSSTIVHELLDLADKAMYQAKHTGKNKVLSIQSNREASSENSFLADVSR